MKRCPICKRKIEAVATNPFRPFCSERCKLIDLDNWLSDRYSVSSPLTPAEEEEGEETPPAEADIE